MTVKAILIVGIFVVCLIWMVAGKIRHGSACCGEYRKPDIRIRPDDKNPKHYPYHYLLHIEGMVCGNCARKVENAFHGASGILAKVDLGSRTVRVHAKQPITEEEAVQILSGTSYTIMEFQNEEENHEIK